MLADFAAWAILFAVFLALPVIGYRFRRGLHREYLAYYRSPTQPRFWRLAPLVAPVLAALMIPVLVLVTPMIFDLAIPELPRGIQGFLIFGTVAYTLFVLGICCLLIVRPPSWLFPRWLREDDLRVGYALPRKGASDVALILAGLLFVLLGTAASVAAIAHATSGS